jgi:hypothetical protein
VTEETLHTVTDRMQAMHVPEGLFNKGAVASSLSARWQALTGTKAEFPDVPKVNGRGTHKISAYPPWFWPEMDAAIVRALSLPKEQVERKARRPRAVRKAIDANREAKALKDITPKDGARFWFKFEEDPDADDERANGTGSGTAGGAASDATGHGPGA